MQMAIAHFMGAQTLAALPLARAPVLVSRPTCSLSLRLSPVTRASPPTRSQAVTRRLRLLLTTVWRKPEARATLKLPFKFKFKLR